LPLGLALPIGISFYTFQILSYTIDLYRGDASLQRNFFTFSTYVMLFPQLIAGPIVRYVDVERELAARAHTMARFAQGARRFVVGLGKKVLIANVLGELVDIYKKSGDRSALFAWLYIAAYALHIYFDFSGYSDMAIGMGHMFGFHFLENFNYPYISRSITEFWRRWHISLSTWFRDYVYIPLGGNRVAAPRYVLNIFVVWFLTGFWHGAGWNFIVWGLYFAVLLMLEKYVLGKALARLPAAVPHALVLLLVMVGWVFFDAADLRGALSTLSVMFGAGAGELASAEAAYYLRSYLVPLLAAAVGCTPLPSALARRLFASGGAGAEDGEEAVDGRLAAADGDEGGVGMGAADSGDGSAGLGAAATRAGAAGATGGAAAEGLGAATAHAGAAGNGDSAVGLDAAANAAVAGVSGSAGGAADAADVTHAGAAATQTGAAGNAAACTPSDAGVADSPGVAADAAAAAHAGAATTRTSAAGSAGSRGRALARLRMILEPLGIAALLIAITAYLVDGSFNPFIYFRF
jgi:D-alanyl-lipoteichoic acid acyltransferase DltB (MBOAT superfamily)